MTVFEKLKCNLLQNQHTWLITGAAGFIGSNLLEALLKLNQKVVGLDNFATGFQHNIDDVLSSVGKTQKNFTFYQADIRNLEDCRKAVSQVDFVLHQAALGSVPRSILTPEITNETNVSGFLNMLIAAKDAKVKRFVYASSSSVYGDSPVLPKVETQIGNPLSPYAVSKYTNELYAKAFSTCYDMQTIGLRYFNVFGPRQNPKGAYAAVIPTWVSALLQNKAVIINGDGNTTRDFCFVENAIQANLLAATSINPEASNKVYNVAVGEQNTLKKLYELIAKNLNLTDVSQETYQDFRAGDIRYSLADIEMIKKLLGYEPTHNLNDGLKVMMDWYISAIKLEKTN